MNLSSRFHHKTCLIAALALTASACSLPNAPATKAAAAMSQPYSSGEILQVLQTVNNAEIKQAGIVMQRSNTPAVQEVAQLIIQDHKMSNQRIASVAQATSVKMDESVLSTGIRTQGNEIADNLTGLSGRELDCTYLQKQIEQHALVLRTVREQLLPGAEQPQVRELLMAAAPKLEKHLEAARGHRAHLQCPQS
jgi:predicted outer membrane protein